MTNPKGRYFISYCRSPRRPGGTQEAVMVHDALRDRGAPTWRDVDDLDSEPTEDALVLTLNDSDTAGAVMLIAPEVENSPMIRKVESFHIFKRHRTEDTFFVKPVLIGLDYKQADTVLDNPAGLQSLTDWNQCKLSADHLTENDANMIARSVLKSRLKLIVKAAPDKHLDVALLSRRISGPRLFSLCHDFSPYFEGRSLRDTGSYHRIESALIDTATTLTSVHDKISIAGQGVAALPLGVLYGAVFSPLAGFRVSWLQRLDEKEDTWSLATTQSNILLRTEEIMGDPGSEDIVLAVSISANIQVAVADFVSSSNLRPRASIHTMLDTGPVPQGIALSPQDGLTIVLKTVQSLRDMKERIGLRRVRLHLFLACPLAMAVLLGQKLNTISECVLYEHHSERSPSYIQVHAFNPSNLPTTSNSP